LFTFQNTCSNIHNQLKTMLLIIIGFSLIACKKETPFQPVETDRFPKLPEYLFKPSKNAILIQFNSLFHGSPILQLDSLFMNDSTGIPFKFTSIKFIISNIELHEIGGNWRSIVDAYGLYNAMIPVDSFYIRNVPNGSYDQIKFDIGLDSSVNHDDPMRWPRFHPLDPQYCQMYWGWSGGYIFHALEGKIIKNNQEEGFSFHIGGDLNKATVILSKSNQPLMMNNNVQKWNIDHDLHQYFYSEEFIDFRKVALSAHTPDDTTVIKKLVRNTPKSFQWH
jgi:hypothetical protein